MPVDDMTMRMVAALLRPKQSPTVNALADRYMNPPPRNWLSQPLPMEGRFNILPIRESQPGMGPSLFNKRELALPGMLAALVNAATAPGRAAFGSQPFNAEEEAVNFAGSFMGGGLLGSRIRPAPRGSVGMNAYHGSPHRFDSFDMSKIGTGEGAQAYGHGVYFAENPDVARTYQYVHQPSYSGSLPKQQVDEALRISRGDKAAALAFLQSRFDALLTTNKYSEGKLRGHIQDAINNFDELASNGVGNFYHVDIPDEAVGKMLDWDKPLRDQPLALDALKKVFANNPQLSAAWNNGPALSPKNMTGGQLYKALAGGVDSSGKRFMSGAQVSAALRDAGIPGIRYFDGGSRATGQGTRNIVLFDERLARITKRE